MYFIQVLKIQPKTFKSSYIKLIALLWSLVFSLIFSFIFRFGLLNFPLKTPNSIYIAVLVLFAIFGVVYLITAIVYIVVRNVRKDCKCLKVVWLVDIAYLVGGIFYYAGINFPLIVKVFPALVPCSTIHVSCQC